MQLLLKLEEKPTEPVLSYSVFYEPPTIKAGTLANFFPIFEESNFQHHRPEKTGCMFVSVRVTCN